MADEVVKGVVRSVVETETDETHTGIKEYSEWPTIPQLYVDGEFVGGCDILVSMHQNGELTKLLEEKKVLVLGEGGESS